MTRVDTLKANSDAGCEPVRQITKKCNGNKPAKGNKDKSKETQNHFVNMYILII